MHRAIARILRTGSKVTIARRLQCLIALSIVSVLVLGVYALLQLKTVADRSQYMVDNTLPSYEVLFAAAGSTRLVGVLTYKHLLFDEPAGMKGVEDEMGIARKRLQDSLDKYGKDLISNEDDKRAFELVRQAEQAYLAVVDKTLAMSRAGDKKQARDYFNDNRALAGKVAASIDTHRMPRLLVVSASSMVKVKSWNMLWNSRILAAVSLPCAASMRM